MYKTKDEKGITLVALVITIIVLILLVAVTITSVKDAGIIGYAENATNEYQEKAQQETHILKDYEEKIRDNLSTVEDKEEIELMEKYVLGNGKEGRPITDIANGLNASSNTVTSFVKDEDSIKNADKTMTPLYSTYIDGNKNISIYAEYNDKVYGILVNKESLLTESVELVYKPEGREGTTIQYDSDGDGNVEDWVIITDRNNKVEIVSKETMYLPKIFNAGDQQIVIGEIKLKLGADNSIKTEEEMRKYLDLNGDGSIDDLDGDGIIDEGGTNSNGNGVADQGGTDLNGDGKIEVDKGDVAIASYNNVTTIINDYCKEIVSSESDEKVRSIGYVEETVENYSSTNFDSWFKNKNTVPIKGENKKYEEDLTKLYYHGIANGGDDYFLPARYISEETTIEFCVRGVSSNGSLVGTILWTLNSKGVVNNWYGECGVRPVIMNPSGI